MGLPWMTAGALPLLLGRGALSLCIFSPEPLESARHRESVPFSHYTHLNRANAGVPRGSKGRAWGDGRVPVPTAAPAGRNTEGP